MFVWLYWEHAPHNLLLIWLAAFWIFHALELSAWARNRQKLKTLDELKQWHLNFTFFAIMAGLMWSSAIIAFHPLAPAEDYIAICLVLGIAAGAVTTNPMHPPSLFGFVLAVSTPFVAHLAFVGDEQHLILGMMLLIFVALILKAAWGMSMAFEQAIRLRLENENMVKELSIQKSETEFANSMLEHAYTELRQQEAMLEQMIHERTSQLHQKSEEILLIKEATIIALSSLAETRDNETGNHIRRTQRYIRSLAHHLRDHPRFSDFLSDDNINLLFRLAPLHDIGKVGIPDHILLKPGKLTVEEFEIMKQHTVLGGNAIASAENDVNIAHSHFLRIAHQVAIGHHEKWDGSGYPFGLSGDDIPIAARLMALADVYDALTTRRVYKPALRHEDVVEIILRERARHFDPDIVDAFQSIHIEFLAIATEYSDELAHADETS